MVSLDKAIVARIEKDGQKFEILVDPDLALKMRQHQSVSMNDLLATDVIYSDAKRAEAQSTDKIKKAFGTTEVDVVARKIIMDGEVQLTTDQRRKLREQKRLEIINMISRNAINPQTNTPHPPKRIELAMEEAKVHIDEFKSVADQSAEIIKKIKLLIPISMEQQQVAIKVPAQFAGKVNAALHHYNIKKQEWGNDGSLMAVIELAPGMREEFFNELNKLTGGSVESKILSNK